MKVTKKGNINAVLNKVAANYLIAIDALNRANMDPEDFNDGVKHLENNTINIAKYLSEKDGVNIMNNFLRKFKSSLFVIKIE